MPLFRNFRFLNDRLNLTFIALMLQSNLRAKVDDNGVVYYEATDEAAVEDVLTKVRDTRFDSWQILSCPGDSVNNYRQYMKQIHVPFVEELNDGQVEFLLPQNVEPHDWKITKT